ncbi:hypothetical protein VHUM_02122 [Vanrija humicola]|uniref:ubiquitinyl hydrolase 1 n=1 Tax=Vanrija humicola TaxID=5417 RepID=A0A7D8Z0E7_VANHU|nr:hypothetical protein VHUM_02122 [Vanrija humicola]
MEGMDGDVMNKPLISGPVPLLAIKAEYLRGSPQVLRKLEWLEQNGWDQVWRARGDGDCFYRSFTLAYLLRILYAPNPAKEAGAALTAIQATVPVMERVGFQSDILEEFIDPLINVIVSFIDPPHGQQPTEFTLLQLLQDAEKSNCIVVALRLMTGAHIRTHPDDFAPFLFSPVTLEPTTPDAFCREEVEPCGKEADHAQIMALASALAVPLRVAYLDRSDISGDDVINWVEFGEQKGAEEELRPLTLLYRPGHFDVVTKDHIMQAALVQTRHELADTPPVVPTPPPQGPPVAAASAVAPVAAAPAVASAAAASQEPAEAVAAAPPADPAPAAPTPAVGTGKAHTVDPATTEPSEAPATPPSYSAAPSEPAAASELAAPSEPAAASEPAPSEPLAPEAAPAAEQAKPIV